jgi:hypothetical protein
MKYPCKHVMPSSRAAQSPNRVGVSLCDVHSAVVIRIRDVLRGVSQALDYAPALSNHNSNVPNLRPTRMLNDAVETLSSTSLASV